MSKNIMKTGLELVNHTKKEIYDVGDIYRKDDRPTPLAMKLLPEPDYEVSYNTLVRILLSIRHDNVSLQLGDLSDPKTDSYRFYASREILERFDEIFPVEEGWDDLS